MMTKYLTLEDLYDLNGKPVWVISKDNKRVSAWHLVVLQRDIPFVQHVGTCSEDTNRTFAQKFYFKDYG